MKSYCARLLEIDIRFISKHLLNLGFFFFALTAPCFAQQPASVSAQTLSPADKGKVIYVRDFEVDPGAFKQDKGGITGKGYLLPPPPGLSRKRQDPEVASRKLARLMSESLVADLQKAGFTAVRLYPLEPRPTEGLLVTGVFTQLSEGNQMRRTLLGFGSGASKIELIVKVSDASQPDHSLYDDVNGKTSGKKPGAVMTLSPAIAVVKFGMTKNAPEKTVKKTADKIAKELTRQLNGETQIAKN